MEKHTKHCVFNFFVIMFTVSFISFFTPQASAQLDVGQADVTSEEILREDIALPEIELIQLPPEELEKVAEILRTEVPPEELDVIMKEVLEEDVHLAVKSPSANSGNEVLNEPTGPMIIEPQHMDVLMRVNAMAERMTTGLSQEEAQRLKESVNSAVRDRIFNGENPQLALREGFRVMEQFHADKTLDGFKESLATHGIEVNLENPTEFRQAMEKARTQGLFEDSSLSFSDAMMAMQVKGMDLRQYADFGFGPMGGPGGATAMEMLVGSIPELGNLSPRNPEDMAAITEFLEKTGQGDKLKMAMEADATRTYEGGPYYEGPHGGGYGGWGGDEIARIQGELTSRDPKSKLWEFDPSQPADRAKIIEILREQGAIAQDYADMGPQTGYGGPSYYEGPYGGGYYGGGDLLASLQGQQTTGSTNDVLFQYDPAKPEDRVKIKEELERRGIDTTGVSDQPAWDGGRDFGHSGYERGYTDWSAGGGTYGGGTDWSAGGGTYGGYTYENSIENMAARTTEAALNQCDHNGGASDHDDHAHCALPENPTPTP